MATNSNDQPPAKKPNNVSIGSPQKQRSSLDYVKRVHGKFHLLIGCTGSVASIKIPEMMTEIRKHCEPHSANLLIRVVATENALRFFDRELVAAANDGVPVFTDKDEWTTWKQRGDPILHIELRKWADLMLIAPLDANTLGKIANGLCDNLLTCVVRAWDTKKPLYFCPAMNTHMWEHPITYKQMETLRGLLGYKEMPCIEKELMCGDKGYGAMTTLPMIGSVIASEVKNHFAIYTG